MRNQTDAPQKNMTSTIRNGTIVQAISRVPDSCTSVATSSGERRRYLIAKTTTSVPIRIEKNAVTAIMKP